jgi:hypothetical protein
VAPVIGCVVRDGIYSGGWRWTMMLKVPLLATESDKVQE